MTANFRPTGALPSSEPSDKVKLASSSPIIHADSSRSVPNPMADGQAASSHTRQTPLPGLTPSQSPIVLTQTSRLKALQWFYNLSVRSKQLVGLFTAEAIAILGFVSGSSLLMISGGRTQLITQALTELAVHEAQYTLQMEQIGLGFRGQSDNIALTQAASEYAQYRSIKPETAAVVKQILRNEIAARTLEYATLVGADRRIIANAHQNRAGDVFDPNGLVGMALAESRLIQANAIVHWEELQREGAALPKDFNNQDALIRYTITPIRAIGENQVIGALVAGEIINHKPALLKGTLAALNPGYSAIYLYQPNGEWRLAASLENADEAQAIAVNTPLSDIVLLDKAASANGEPIAQTVTQNRQRYTMAAKALLNVNGDPVGVLVRGATATELTQLLQQSLQLQLVVGGLTIFAGLIIARTLGRSISKPLRHLTAAAQEFTAGNRRTRAEVFTQDEVGQVAHTFNQLADSIVASEEILRRQTQHHNNESKQTHLLLEEIARSTVKHQQELETVFQSALEGARELLGADRVIIYRFLTDWSGYIASESVGQDWPRALNTTLEDACIPASLIEAYKNNRVAPINDIFKANLHPDHLKLLQRLHVQANLVVPLLHDNELFGLLIAHHCADVYEWRLDEIDFLRQLAVQLGVTLDRLTLFQAREADVKRSQILKDITLLMTQADAIDSLLTALPLEPVRHAIAADRVFVYRFDPSWNGSVIAESAGEHWPYVLGAEMNAPWFGAEYIDQYRQGEILAISNLPAANLTDSYLQLLAPFSIKATLVNPIRKGNHLMGLLIAHQCSNPRQWERSTINFFNQVGNQIGIALDRYELLHQRETAAQQARLLATEQREQKERLQQQLIELLSDIEEASRGNLTVRADVTAGDVGTVADFFNSIMENLRQLVTQVKQSASQVNHALEQDEVAIRQLSDEVLNQAEDTTRTMNSVEQMERSIQAVADSARQAAAVIQTAAAAAEIGGIAMDRTVDNISTLRTRIGETSKKVKHLGESSQQISRVVALIEKISLQTNLLAINAGIEAARAGEDGQGFAVVAEEVGGLASQASEAAQDINRIVETIQLETGQVMAAMEESTAQVVEGAQVVEETKDSLEQIVEVSHQIDELVQSISEATVSQTETSQTVMDLMKAITQVSEHTAAGSRQVAMSLRQTVAVSQQLQTAVDTFKVS